MNTNMSSYKVFLQIIVYYIYFTFLLKWKQFKISERFCKS